MEMAGIIGLMILCVGLHVRLDRVVSDLEIVKDMITDITRKGGISGS